MKSGFRNSNGNGLKALPNVADLNRSTVASPYKHRAGSPHNPRIGQRKLKAVQGLKQK